MWRKNKHYKQCFYILIFIFFLVVSSTFLISCVNNQNYENQISFVESIKNVDDLKYKKTEIDVNNKIKIINEKYSYKINDNVLDFFYNDEHLLNLKYEYEFSNIHTNSIFTYNDGLIFITYSKTDSIVNVYYLNGLDTYKAPINIELDKAYLYVDASNQCYIAVILNQATTIYKLDADNHLTYFFDVNKEINNGIIFVGEYDNKHILVDGELNTYKKDEYYDILTNDEIYMHAINEQIIKYSYTANYQDFTYGCYYSTYALYASFNDAINKVIEINCIDICNIQLIPSINGCYYVITYSNEEPGYIILFYNYQSKSLNKMIIENTSLIYCYANYNELIICENKDSNRNVYRYEFF